MTAVPGFSAPPRLMRRLGRAWRGLKAELAPTDQQRALRRWHADGVEQTARFDYELGPDAIALDVGGYRGGWAAEAFARFACRVHVFEPVGAFADGIERRFARNPMIAVHRFGLGGADRAAAMTVAGDASSLFGAAPETVPVRIADVATWLTNSCIERVSLMKMNIEGGEYELLERLIDTGLVAAIDHLQIQFHDIAPDSVLRMAAVKRALTRTHTQQFEYRFVWENWSRRARTVVEAT
jgi:FkbM family methyltransferase